MKKKIVVAMMAVTLALGAVACGEKAPIAPATQESSTEATAEATDKADEATSKESADAAGEATSDASAEASSEATSEEAGKSSEFTSGVIKDNVYENEFFNVKCPVLDGMKYGDEAKLEQVNGNVTDVLSNDKLKKSVENGTSVIVAYAEDSNTGTTLPSLRVYILSISVSSGASSEPVLPRSSSSTPSPSISICIYPNSSAC